MIQMTADDTILVKDLGAFAEPVEVLNSTGGVLGLFVPANACAQSVGARPAAKIDPAELKRRKEQETGKGRRLYEIFEHLKTLTTDPEEQADLQMRIDRLRAEDGCDTP